MIASIDGATAVAGVSGGLAAFIAVAITWRLPATVNALARDPALAAVEMITLLAAGTGLWLELANASHGPGQLPRRHVPPWQPRPCGLSGYSPT